MKKINTTDFQKKAMPGGQCVYPDYLLPCPFCGSTPKSFRGTNVDCMTQDNRPSVGCKKCGIGIHADSAKEVKLLWNTRIAIKDRRSSK